MSTAYIHRASYVLAMTGLVIVLSLVVQVAAADETKVPSPTTDSGEVQERGLTDKLKGRDFKHELKPLTEPLPVSVTQRPA